MLLFAHGTTVGKYLLLTFGLETVRGGSRLMALPRNSDWKRLLEVLVQSRSEDALSILRSNLKYAQRWRCHSLSGTLFECLTTVIPNI